MNFQETWHLWGVVGQRWRGEGVGSWGVMLCDKSQQICKRNFHVHIIKLTNLCVLCFSDQFSVYAAGRARWGEVVTSSDGGIWVRGWSPEDLVEVLQAHKETHPQHTWGEGVIMHIDHHRDLWGEPAESCWSQQAWTSLLQLVPHYWGRGEGLSVRVPHTAPLRGLIACLTSTQLSGGGGIYVYYGQASLVDVEDWVTRWQGTGGFQLRWTHIVLPSGESEASLRARTDSLCKVRGSWGERMVDEPQWITETGEEYTWSDALENQHSSDDYETCSDDSKTYSDDYETCSDDSD